jgi:hypothetical protein
MILMGFVGYDCATTLMDQEADASTDKAIKVQTDGLFMGRFPSQFELS